MDVDDDFIERFNEQIRVLQSMKKSIEGAIERAQARLTRIKAGESIDKVFGALPKK